MGIRHVGATVAQKLSSAFKTIDALALASIEEMEAVDEIGKVIAESVHYYFTIEENRTITRVQLTEYLPQQGDNFPSVISKNKSESDFSNEREIMYKVLFDMKNDPDETCNLAGKPEYKEVEQKMKNELLQWLAGTYLHSNSKAPRKK